MAWDRHHGPANRQENLAGILQGVKMERENELHLARLHPLPPVQNYAEMAQHVPARLAATKGSAVRGEAHVLKRPPRGGLSAAPRLLSLLPRGRRPAQQSCKAYFPLRDSSAQARAKLAQRVRVGRHSRLVLVHAMQALGRRAPGVGRSADQPASFEDRGYELCARKAARQPLACICHMGSGRALRKILHAPGVCISIANTSLCHRAEDVRVWRACLAGVSERRARDSPAQKKDSPSVWRGKKMLLAMPTFENGFPTSVRA